VWRAVVPHCVLGKAGEAGWQDRLRPRHIDKDVLRVIWFDIEPVRIIEGARVHTAHFGKSLESQIKFRPACRTEVNVDDLAAISGTVLIDGWGASCDLKISLAEDRLYHIGRAGRALAEPAVADRNAKWVVLDRVSHRPTEASTLMNSHGSPLR